LRWIGEEFEAELAAGLTDKLMREDVVALIDVREAKLKIAA
jgi:hypothetical protein